MVMLSDFLRFRLTDRQQRRARLWDVAVDLAAGDYPCVARVVIRFGARRRFATLPWSDVASIDWPRRAMEVTDFDAATDAQAEQTEVRARRDILDALIVD